MSVEIIEVQKPLDKRLDEISCIFSGRRVTVPEVKEVWSNVIELTLRNNSSWQALWKVPRTVCEDLNIPHPSMVFVEVGDVNYEDLIASVNVLAVEDDIELGQQQEAFLLDLYPTVQQENTSLSILDIAHCLDNFRFFYHSIWQPWDEDDDKNQDWIANRLEPRVKLFRDMRAGLIGPLTVVHTRRLLQEASALYKRKLSLELRDESDEFIENDTMRKCFALEQMELQHQLDLVKHKIEIVENTFLRENAIEIHLQKQRSKLYSTSQKFYVVWHGGKYNDLINLMHEACSTVPEDADIRPCELKIALEQADENDTIFLCSGIHKISNEILVSRNVTIHGFPSCSEVILTLEQPGPSLFEWGGAKLKLKDLTLSGQVVQSLLSIRGGTVELNDCQLTADPRSVATGVHVMPGATVKIINCQLSGLDTAIVADIGASLQLVHCSISSCGVGIQVFEGAEVEIKNCHFLNCSDCGLLLRTSEDSDQSMEGSLKLLDGNEFVNIQNVVMEGNGRDVHISPVT